MSEVLKIFGPQVYNTIMSLLKSQNIHVLTGITLKGIVDTGSKLKIHFKYRPYDKVENKLYEGFDKSADIVIKKTNLGQPVINFHTLSDDKDGHLETQIDNSLRVNPNYQASTLIDIDHFIYAVGPSVSTPSIFGNEKLMRTSNTANNIIQGYVAGLNLAEKKYHLDFPPVQHFEIASQHFFYLGERGQNFTNPTPDISMKGDNKFVMYYSKQGRVIGALIMGYKNLHIYLSQAIQIGVFPERQDMINMKVTSKDIVERVLQNQDKIRCTNEKELQTRISHKFYERDYEIEEYKEQREREKQALEKEKQRRTEIYEEQTRQDQENRKRKDGQVQIVRNDANFAAQRAQKSRDSILHSYIGGMTGKSKKA